MPIASNQTLLLLTIQNYAYFLNYPNIFMLKLPPPAYFDQIYSILTNI